VVRARHGLDSRPDGKSLRTLCPYKLFGGGREIINNTQRGDVLGLSNTGYFYEDALYQLGQGWKM
jgi:peptide subunit release factor RF-3